MDNSIFSNKEPEVKAGPKLRPIVRWLNELPKECRDEAIQETTKSGNMLDEVSSMRDALEDGFFWADSKSGNKYWAEICNKY